MATNPDCVRRAPAPGVRTRPANFDLLMATMMLDEVSVRTRTARTKSAYHRISQPKVPKYAEASNIQLAGLAEGSNGGSGTRLGHATAHGRSQDIGRFATFVLWCLGRRRKPVDFKEG